AQQWNSSQYLMRKILDHMGLSYKEAAGEAAFYGPKLDIQIKNVHGKEDTLITIQVDLMLAERFGMEYVDRDGVKKHPYIIHRTSMGCYERTLALLLEKYAGALPAWLAPVQAKILPITDRNHAYAQKICNKLKEQNIRVEIDDRSEKIGYKIREAQLEKVPYMLVLGDKEEEGKKLAVRNRKDGNTEEMVFDEFLTRLKKEISEKAL
ncbi:MAG: His/Gly/Thr/Pro-type tRNA ligase C-terminal domain-containing protein, partial [Clostridiales bacterium]|nr:His/Gly/Thr/Pro-type tRNA ligase C-terminal domain-containing protein [Clostridiales bacterium]